MKDEKTKEDKKANQATKTSSKHGHNQTKAKEKKRKGKRRSINAQKTS